MGRECSRVGCVPGVVLACLLILASSAATAHAKPWAKWAPSPLGSDSAYAALSALPADSLIAGQLAWLVVQRDWRAEREDETTYATSRHDAGRLHSPRPSDQRFAVLASQPYASLSTADIVWLVAETAAHRGARERSMDELTPAQTIVIAAALAALVLIVVDYGDSKRDFGWP